MKPCPFTITFAEMIVSSDDAMVVKMLRPRYSPIELRSFRNRVFVKIPMGYHVCYADITEAIDDFKYARPIEDLEV